MFSKGNWIPLFFSFEGWICNSQERSAPQTPPWTYSAGFSSFPSGSHLLLA